MSDLVDDCWKCIMDRLSFKDWRSFTLACCRFYKLSTPEERLAYLDGSKGGYYCASVGNVLAVTLLTKKGFGSNNYIDLALVAAAYNRLDLIKWLLENRRETISALGWLTWAALKYKSEATLNYLSLRCDPRRRYWCRSEFTYKKVKVRIDAEFCLIRALNESYYYNRDYHQKSAAVEIMTRMMAQLGIENPPLNH